MSDTVDLDSKVKALGHRIGVLKGHLPRPGSQFETAPPMPPLSCPECRAAMEPGEVRLHGDLGTWIMFGFGLEHAWFKPDGGGKEERVVHTTLPRRAYRCPACRTVVISGSEPVA